MTTQHAELRKVKEDLTSVSLRLDEFVRSCQNDAEVKRIHYESLCEQERFAKQEYESAKKEYERVDKRRKKEVSGLEAKVKNVEKNISKSEDAVKKRIAELDKVREKIAQLQTEGS
jgi:septal ring factor EnvC (AmiA/AmiB activator)